MKTFLTAVAVLLTLSAGSRAYAQDPAPAPAAAAATDITGPWDITTVSPIGEQTNRMVISKEGDALKAVAKSDAGEAPYDKVEISGSAVRLVLTINYEGTPMIITYSGNAEASKMGGTADFGGLAEGTWSAVKK